jgi:hypothetical protein
LAGSWGGTQEIKEEKLERGETNLSSCRRRISGLNLRRMCKTRVAACGCLY